jgi:plasmid maintenance system antidote protein VapI
MIMRVKQTFKFDPDYVVSPGKTIEENIASLGMTKANFARRMGIPIGTLHRLISSEIPLSVDFALKLEYVTKVPSAFWNALEAQYRTILSRQTLFQAQEKKWLRKQPLKVMLERGWISGETDIDRYLSALSFYRVASLSAWANVWENTLSKDCIPQKYQNHSPAIAALIRAGEIEAEKIPCKPFSAKAFQNVLVPYRSIKKQKLSHRKLIALRKSCAEAGVALACVRSLDEAPLNGATRWLGKNKAMILLTDTNLTAFFREAGHVLSERKKKNFLTYLS